MGCFFEVVFGNKKNKIFQLQIVNRSMLIRKLGNYPPLTQSSFLEMQTLFIDLSNLLLKHERAYKAFLPVSVMEN